MEREKREFLEHYENENNIIPKTEMNKLNYKKNVKTRNTFLYYFLTILVTECNCKFTNIFIYLFIYKRRTDDETKLEK